MVGIMNKKKSVSDPGIASHRPREYFFLKQPLSSGLEGKSGRAPFPFEVLSQLFFVDVLVRFRSRARTLITAPPSPTPLLPVLVGSAITLVLHGSPKRLENHTKKIKKNPMGRLRSD